MGIEACDGDVVLCNDDAVCLSPDWDELFRRQGTTPGLASIGVTSNNILKHQLMGLSGPAWMKTDAISFFFAYLSRDAIETVGLLDEAFGPGPNDDLDWCFRARKLDYEHYVDRRILVWHFRNGSQTLGKLCPDSSAQEASGVCFPTAILVGGMLGTSRQYGRGNTQRGSSHDW